MTVLLKVGISRYGTSRQLQVYTKVWIKLLLLIENALKLKFWGPLSNWKFEPSPKAHAHSDPIINKHTKQVKKLGMDLSWHALNKKKSRHTHQNPLKSSPVSERSAYPLQNYVCFSPLTSGLESFGHKSTPSDRPWIELSKILASTKMGWA